MTNPKIQDPEEVYEYLSFNAKYNQCIGFYLHEKITMVPRTYESTGGRQVSCEIKSIPFDLRNKSHCISKIESIQKEAGFMKWYGIDKIISMPDTPQEVVNIMESWHNEWLNEKI
jgi:hypothetical protein